MGKLEPGILDFFNDIRIAREPGFSTGSDLRWIDTFPLVRGKQAIYVVDWDKAEVIFSRGIGELLGYAAREKFNLTHSVQQYHPDDATIVQRIVRGLVNHCSQSNNSDRKEYLHLVYRIKKADGSYIKVLRQSTAHEIDSEGRLLSNVSFLTDISFIANHDKVEWDVYANNFDTTALRETVYKEFVNFFTKRELDVIGLIAKGETNTQIAESLTISKHTVSTHRKNILAKSRCSNAADLLAFCKGNGIL
ncbi:LuxR C-terminal-related transcriptional regulator [Zeaxanthinibacter sp. PT1]|uniref:LuxR C-terminal-related transcriptional regulator n=1 Tax=Zeaxanthinibacter TaxID=561554 RepID=UPI00234B3250|nr:LuxR C-terminal-related transcriptional regulator [Zeaxanthinibacter sp. PT1]MDC6352068.1 LuxR C-terminal-related transcriptional regulator [Zeaxanthinibacter sp. PT1]